MMYEYLPHTADEVIKAEGKTLGELFANGLKGMNNILKKDFCEKVDHFDSQMFIEIKSADRTNLLIDFLSEVLSLSNVQKSIYCHVYFCYISETNLVAQLYGNWFGYFDEDIKGITYHEANIRQNANGNLETCILFDL